MKKNKKQTEISVYVKHPNKEPIRINVKNSLEELQRLVCGYIESVTITKDMAILCDEDGRIKGKKYNCTIAGIDFVGTIVIVGVIGDSFTDAPPENALHILFTKFYVEKY